MRACDRNQHMFPLKINRKNPNSWLHTYNNTATSPNAHSDFMPLPFLYSSVYLKKAIQSFNTFFPIHGKVTDRISTKYSHEGLRDIGSIPGSGRSLGGGYGNPLQYSCLENPTEVPGGLQSMGSQRVGHD